MLKKKGIIIALVILNLCTYKVAHAQNQNKTLNSQDKNLIPVIIHPVDSIKFSSPITGLIEKIPFKQGMTFAKDDTLIEYNCTVMHAEKEKAQALAEQLKEKAVNMQKLYHLGGASRNELTETKSQAKAAEEELKIKLYIVSNCVVKAPFDGQVAELFVSEHEHIDQGKPLIEVVNLKKLEIKLILPSEWLNWVKEGTQFKIKLDETNRVYPAKIARLTYSIDPVSNTFTAFAVFTESNEEVKPGMSGYADFGRK